MSAADIEVYDLVGIGFGPSNLALAIAVEEHNARCTRAEDRISAIFLEKQDDFGWHRGMLFDNATMQVSFLKDLVTMRNPASDFSFVSYLHAHGRLADFINYKTVYPLRVEFHDYFRWAAGRMSEVVRYGHTVTDVVPVPGGDLVDVIAATPSGGRTVRARNVSLALGLEPSLPPGVKPSERIWHNLDILHRVAAFEVAEPRRLIVVGAGQSAAESVSFLHSRYPTAEVCSVFFRYGYSPADDSNYANRIFDPEAVDVYYDAPADVKRMLFDYHRNTNYSVVDGDLIEELYRRQYAEKVLGRPRLRMLNASRVAELTETPDGVWAVVEHLPSGEREPMDADAIVFATGYRPVDPARLLGAAGELCLHDDESLLRIGRDYRLETGDQLRAGLYLQGGTEHAHGITATLLSAVAVRSGEIVASIAAAVADRAPVPPAAGRPLATIGERYS
ncbi:lysine N(6)-hydroxylase/L-ornithine N(5)-oxygenase family protein [Micromonospora craniellae]|uniref:L-lysine N6-monooxygenase MbtG n=1 Tax=Micromonospora craniellae TaxID=2294034 RepID=A0A372FS62_9ACTN|nr:lysine N(6)-hydroxylase/L-ornithine N(5)-oxygenase family protein [Micromonospora craniellae]QOC94761.1 lysine N(6)-hydroxylase/L-ornithine N(5)-oxygenase family protein [Micromonospora craniellae]RFS43548.1 L-lysine 6-monooxygenase [Micromonospora craniellae]